ncbi:MAG: sugar ABC transporter substrate-binding protein [Spirochaetota bacterium]|nr:MAG: sugar ABC transporter substrate-binding protein [Spirochaetota bacterium]
MFKKRLLKIIAVVFIFSLVCTVSFARGGKDKGKPAEKAPSAETKKDIKGTVKIYKGPFVANEVELYNNIITEFNKEYPNIKVIHEMFDWPTMEAQLTASVAGGTHDVIYFPEGMYPKFCYKGGPLEDLSSYIEDPAWQEERNNILYWEAATAPDGHLGGVPYVWNPQSFLYANLDMLKEAGAPDDWYTSMDKVRDAAIKMTKGDKYGFAFRTGGFAQMSWFDWYSYILRSGADFLNEDFTACGLNKPELVETFQWLADLQNKDKVMPEYGGYTWDGLQGLFQAGKIGILNDETILLNLLKENPPDFEYSCFPAPGNARDVLLVFRGFFAIPETSKNKEAAWEVIKFWSRPEMAVPYINSTFAVYPVLKDYHGIELYPGAEEIHIPLEKNFYELAQGPQFHPQMVEFQNVVQPLFDELMLGKITPQQLIDQACSQINEKLKKCTKNG